MRGSGLRDFGFSVALRDPNFKDLGFRVWGLGFRGLGFRV